MIRSGLLHAGALCTLLGLGTAHASQTEYFTDGTASDFAKGEIRESTLTARGTVQPPHPRARLAELDAAVVWDLLELGEHLYAATGHDGRLFRQMHEEEPELLHEFEETAIYALSAGPDRTVLVAPSPGGRIHRVTEDGELILHAETEVEIIWDMLRHGDATFAATGSPASILRITDDGEAEVLLELEETLNVMQLALTPDGDGLLAVTQGPGHVIRVTFGGESLVLLDPEQEEIRRVATLPDGSIIAAVNAVRSPGQELLSRGPDEGRQVRNQQPQPESYLARIHPDGMIREWWTSPEAPIHDMHPLPEGGMLVSAGGEGNLYIVTADGETDRTGAVREDFVTRLAPGSNNRILIGTGSEAAIHQIRVDRRGDGSYRSRVFDGKGTVRWGRLLGHVHTGGGEVLVATRTGNTAKPDDNWTEWSDAVDFAAGDHLTEGAVARFFQYRVDFKLPADADNGMLPELERMRVFYRRANEPPVINSVSVAPSSGGGSGGGQGGGSGPATQTRNPARMNVSSFSNPGQMDISWSAEDPSGDQLRFKLEIKPAGNGHWMVLEEESTQNRYTLNTRMLPDGEYRARVHADNSATNPQGEGLGAVRESVLFTVDNTVPSISLTGVERHGEESVTVRFEAEDATSLIGSAAWRPGTGDLVLLKPGDGFFDQRQESFSFRVEGEDARAGRLLTILVTDEAGNTARHGVTLE